MAKERLDVLVVEQGLAESREKAKAMIMAGVIFVNEQREDKPGTKLDTRVVIEIKGKVNPYVSRGGFKLEKAIETYMLDLSHLICMDIGASTGGFTDCMLQNGAAKVYAVDVGYGQLAWKLRQNPQVIVMEKTNIRYVTPEDLKDFIDFFSVDVSFISLKKVLPTVVSLLKDQSGGICLIKPQFEAGRDKVGKKGVVREAKTHIEVVEEICCFLIGAGFNIKGLDFSPIKGPEGNIEYLVYIQMDKSKSSSGAKQEDDFVHINNYKEIVQKVVVKAHETL